MISQSKITQFKAESHEDFSAYVAEIKGLTVEARITAIIIHKMQEKIKPEDNRPDGWMYIPIVRIADKSGVSRHIATKAIDELLSRGIIEKYVTPYTKEKQPETWLKPLFMHSFEGVDYTSGLIKSGKSLRKVKPVTCSSCGSHDIDHTEITVCRSCGEVLYELHRDWSRDYELIGEFLRTQTIKQASRVVAKSMMYHAYKMFIEEMFPSDKLVAPGRLSDYLAKFGYQEKHSGNGIAYSGIKFTPDCPYVHSQKSRDKQLRKNAIKMEIARREENDESIEYSQGYRQEVGN